MTKLLSSLTFLAGLSVLIWVGAGYLPSQPLALGVTVVIGVFYLLGAVESWRFERATRLLDLALRGLRDTPASLTDWLEAVPEALRSAVRQRIEGARYGLPGPVLAAYLTGLLILLGMLGTFLGMVVTLASTGAALAGADGLSAIRSALSAPVRGLGLAFGTSVAGVAASAMLGLMLALARRQRIRVARRLDIAVSSTLRPYSSQHQRDLSLKLLEQQASALPTLIDRIDVCMRALERHQQAMVDQLAADQTRFHEQTGERYVQLVATVERSLTASMADSARQAQAIIEPALQSALAALARTAGELHQGLSAQVHTQLDGIAQRFDVATTRVTAQWDDALGAQRRQHETTSGALAASLERFNTAFALQAASLADALADRIGRAHERLTEQQHQNLQEVSATLAQQASALVVGAEQAQLALRDQFAEQDQARLAGWTQSLQQIGAELGQQWRDAGVAAAQHWQQIGDAALQAHGEIGSRAESQALHLVEQLDERARADAARIDAATRTLTGLAETLQTQWREAGAESHRQWQSAGDTLRQVATTITEGLSAQAGETLSQIAQLVQAASEAPRAAADVIGELRQKLADSLAHDNAVLDERNRLLETLATLLDTVNHASGEQRAAIDALVGTSSDLMARAHMQFTDALREPQASIEAAATHVVSGAIEVASLSEAFGGAVKLFGQSSEQLVAQLQQIEVALSQSLTRSDEQLDYYVAQAREVVELSIGAQKQIIDELRQVATVRADDARISRAD